MANHKLYSKNNTPIDPKYLTTHESSEGRRSNKGNEDESLLEHLCDFDLPAEEILHLGQRENFAINYDLNSENDLDHPTKDDDD
ncbi:MAG: hypothetical protein WC755_03355 [Candidatus Woesearchaeota archaeon]|jgi:hypothetical protein